MNKMKLGQIVALNVSAKETAQTFSKNLARATGCPGLFHGFVRTYFPVDDDGEKLPPERKNIQLHSEQVIEELKEAFSAEISSEYLKSRGNAEINVPIAEGNIEDPAGVPFLLYLEKTLIHIKSMLLDMPNRSADIEWKQSDGKWICDEIISQKTKKIQRPIVLYHATEQHPAQTQLITEDVTIGHWKKREISSAMSEVEKIHIIKNIDRLLNAVRFAREEANSRDVDSTSQIGEKILSYIFDNEQS